MISLILLDSYVVKGRRVCGRECVKHRKTVHSGKPVVEEEETTKARNEVNGLCAADSSDINSHFKRQFVGQ